ncbi:MAG TPA: RNA methyltransferase, partial [Acidimicrobiaceae bacterium]|nr:RNA methyltransferase [Acidimicrobiaceae bacterium]
ARAVRGGVECSVTWPQVWAVHLRSRLATRVLVRVQRFRATTWAEMELGLRRVPWATWLDPSAGVTVQATCNKGSALY